MEGEGSVGGCSETANSTEAKRLKTDPPGHGNGDGDATASSSPPLGKPEFGTGAIAEDQDDNNEPNGGGSGMPLVREQLHPLQNPLILVHFFERCPPELLAQCRLVSKQWLELSLTSWRATSTLILFQVTFPQYLEFMDKPENKCDKKPHRQLKLVSWINDLSKEAIQSFWVWSRVGNDLASLELSNCDFPRVDDLRRLIFASCPNLQRLSLHDCTFRESALAEDFRELKYLEPQFGEQTKLRELSFEMPEIHQDFHRLPIHWLELLSHFPSLTSLKVSRNRSVVPGTEVEHEELLRAIQIIRDRDGKKLCLRSFELSPPLMFSDESVGPHTFISLLEELRLPLQTLEIEVHSYYILPNKVLEGVLNRHRNTLSRITVGRSRGYGYSYSRSPYAWWFPCGVVLEKLEELRIHMICTSMEFLKNTPKLKTLEFLEASGYGYCKDVETSIFLEPDASTLAGVKLLHLTEFRMDYKVTSEDITIFAGLMPNLRKLTMSLNDTLFGVVCRYWRDLKEVEVLGEDLTDKGVTGMIGNGGRAPADIRDLLGLESFKFWSQNLTDQSVFGGFLKLPSLKVLEVCEGVMPLGEAARRALQDKNIDFQGNYEEEWQDRRDEDYDELVDEDDRDFY